MSNVKRFDNPHHGPMSRDDNEGDFVEYEDYKILEELLERVFKDVGYHIFYSIGSPKHLDDDELAHQIIYLMDKFREIKAGDDE